MTQVLFCGFKNIFTSNKSQLPKKISSLLTSSNNPFPSSKTKVAVSKQNKEQQNLPQKNERKK